MTPGTGFATEACDWAPCEVLPFKSRNVAAKNNTKKTSINDPNIVSSPVSAIEVVLVTVPVSNTGPGVEVVVSVVKLVCVKMEYAVDVVVVCGWYTLLGYALLG